MAPTGRKPTVELKAILQLTRGSAPKRLSLIEALHLIYMVVPYIVVGIPYQIIFKHLLPMLTFNRIFKSSIRTNIGRPMFADLVARFTYYILARATVGQARATLFGRGWPHSVGFASPYWSGKRRWIKEVREPGVTGRWLADDTTARKDDDLVMLWVHGGGFCLDTAGLAQPFWAVLMTEMLLKRKIRFSVFQLDYELAPEFRWPSQIKETLATYIYLVRDQGIDPRRICFGGDSAGGNIVMGTLLHLARPSPDITMPASYGELPPVPGAAFLMSPFCKLYSEARSRFVYADEDLIEHRAATAAAMDYVGEDNTEFSHFVSWNPRHLIQSPFNEVKMKVAQHRREQPGKAAERESAVQRAERMFANPYISPSQCDDPDWLKAAFPARTLVSWGDREILRDDIIQFVERAEKAGVPIERLRKPLGVHDWILYDWTMPGFATTHTRGVESTQRYGVERLASFLEACTDEKAALRASDTKV